MIDRFVSAIPGPPITWVDVARALCALDPQSKAWQQRPRGLSNVHVDWASVLCTFDSEDVSKTSLKDWILETVPGLGFDESRAMFRLDGPPGLELLDLEIEVAAEAGVPRLSLGAIDGDISFESAGLTPAKRPVPVIACHSVKGGTGRTTSAVAIASALQRKIGKPVLIVDADIDAPGLSYLYSEVQSEISISFEDLITLAHASSDPGSKDVVTWVANRLQAQRYGNLLVLPIRRSLGELASSSVKAEHISSPGNPYALADLLSSTANAAGCGAVVVDLRAGLVPIAAQLMLDPDVPRAISTSLTSQSVKATGTLIDFIDREMRKRTNDVSAPLLIVNRIPSALREYGTDDIILGPLLEVFDRITNKGDVGVPADDAAIYGDDLMPVILAKPYILAKIGEIPDLHVPRTRWDDFAVQLETSGFTAQLKPALDEWLDRALSTEPSRSVRQSFPEKLAEGLSISDRRRKLAAFASAMEFAESRGSISVLPLATRALQALSEEGQNPIVVSEGAKGTGKTLMSWYFVSKGTWKSAVEIYSNTRPSFDADIYPVLGSTIGGGSDYVPSLDRRRVDVARSLGLPGCSDVGSTKDLLTQEVTRRRTQPEWTKFWLNIIAWSAGVDKRHPNPFEELLLLLKAQNKRLLAVIEGIEEIQAPSEGGSFGEMLAALLVDVPAKLRLEQGRPLGVLIFARRDTVARGVPQNIGQFRRQYEQFSLTWEESDVLELTAWLATKSQALDIWTPEFRMLERVQQEEQLELLWGRKLGPDDRDGKRTQEAYTASWVLAVLSDLQGRLTARDLVRFLNEAAEIEPTTADEAQYAGRLLTPTAIRKAINPTSVFKVADIQQEVPELRPVFQKISQNKNVVKAPISAEDMKEMGISDPDLNALKLHGVILDVSPPFEIPELFRVGLGLAYGGRRRNVIGMTRKAKERRGGRAG